MPDAEVVADEGARVRDWAIWGGEEVEDDGECSCETGKKGLNND
jgi:hypothetical protein